MSGGPALAIEGTVDDGGGPVPSPVSPAEPNAWYAPDVRAQYEIHPGVVATVREADTGFDYEVREPTLDGDSRRALDRVLNYFADVQIERPLTRQGALERAAAGFPEKYRRVFHRLLSVSPAARRRIDYYALCALRLFEDLTPLAMDERIELADVGQAGSAGSGGGAGAGGDGGFESDESGRRDESDRCGDENVEPVPETDRLVVHTADYAPAATRYPVDAPHVDRIAAERLARYDVAFHGFDVEVVLYRERLLGDDQFTVKYAVQEPELLPGDEELVAECKERIWETNVEDVVEDRAGFVAQRSREFLARQLAARDTSAWVGTVRYRVRRALAAYGLALPPVDDRYAADRLDDLVYYVLRDYVGHGILTVPIRDPNLEDVEANRVGERVKVVPRRDALDVVDALDRRVPTNLSFDDEGEFVDVVTQLAAADGTELSASTPSAKVNLTPPGVEETIRCAVALPVISEAGPHVSIRKQAPDALTPVDLIRRGTLSTELTALLWLCYEHGRVVLFSGPTGVGKTTIMNACMPFIPFDHRPISIDEGSREVRLPHETGISLTTRDHEREHKRVTMADLMTETNYLNPDVEVIAEINTPESFQTFAETLNTGHGVIGTTHAEDVETLVNRVIEQGLPPYLLREIDLLVFPRRVDGERYVGEAVELVSADAHEALATEATTAGRGGTGVVEKDGRRVHWNAVAWRDTDAVHHFDYDHPELGDADRRSGVRLFDRLAAVTDRDVEAVEAEFRRKHRYVQYLVREDVSDLEELFGILSDLRADEAATVERLRTVPTDASVPETTDIGLGDRGGDRGGDRDGDRDGDHEAGAVEPGDHADGDRR